MSTLQFDRTLLVLATVLVVVLSVGLSTSAIGRPSGPDGPVRIGPAHHAVAQDDFDLVVRSGNTYWRGQRLFFDGSEVVTDVKNASSGQRTFQVRRTTSDNKIGGLVREFVVDTDGEATIRTDTLEGSFVITYNGNPVYVQGGTGYRSSPPDGTAVTVANSDWEVAVQHLTARWKESSILEDEEDELRIQSNRGSYTVEVSARGLSFDDLEDIFPQSSYASNYDAEEDDDIIRLKGSDDQRITADFEGIDTGDYTFTIEVTDTTATASASVTVSRRRATLRFDQRTVTQQAGDIAQVTLRLRHTSRGFLVIGGPDTNFLDVVEVKDNNDDGLVTLRMNTRYMGLNPTDPGVPTGVTVYRVGRGDQLDVYSEKDTLANGRTLRQLRADLEIATDGLQRPLRPGDYPLAAASSDDLRASNGDLEVLDESDVASLSLTSPTLGRATTFIAPLGSAGADLDDLAPKLTQRTTVADGDRVVLRFDVSGMYGYLGAEHDNTLTGLNSPAEGVLLKIEQTNAGPNRERTIDLAQSGARLLTDPDADRLYVVLDTRSIRAGRAIAPGQQFRARLTLTGVTASTYSVKSSSASAYRGYPYLDRNREVSAETTFSIVQPTARFNGVRNDTLLVTNDRFVSVSGTTNLAPGSEIQVRHLATGTNAFLKVATVTVGSDGRWTAAFDFSDGVLNQAFTASVRRGGSTIAAIDGQVVPPEDQPPVKTPVETAAPTPSPEPEPTPSPIVVTRTVVHTRTIIKTPPMESPTATTQAPGQPGFTGLLMVLALFAVAALSRRRR